MMENPLKSLKIENYYSYLLTLGGFLLILSLIIDPKPIPQLKLMGLSIITIIYGIVEWIRKSQVDIRLRHLQNDFRTHWDEESNMKTYEEINDRYWEKNLRINFEEKHKIKEIIPRYHRFTWINLIIYLALMILFYFIN